MCFFRQYENEKQKDMLHWDWNCEGKKHRHGNKNKADFLEFNRKNSHWIRYDDFILCISAIYLGPI